MTPNEAVHATPLFDAVPIQSRDVRTSGGVQLAHPALLDTLHLGEQVYVFGVYHVSGVGHQKHPKRGLLRSDTLSPSELHVLRDDGTETGSLLAQLLMDARDARRRVLDEILGTPSLDGLDEQGDLPIEPDDDPDGPEAS